MRYLLRHDLDALLNAQGLCCSIFLPMNPTGREGMGDPLRLEKGAEEAEQQLRQRGCKTAQVREILNPVRELPATTQWNSRGQSLAIFASPKGLRVLSFDTALEPEVWVDDHFHVRQLVPLVIDSDRYFVLALSEREVQLYEGDAEKLTPVELPGAPANIDEALRIDSADRGLQSHSANVAAFGRSGAIFHGGGGKTNMAQIDLREYFQRVAEAVQRKFNGRTEPLLLATVAENVPIWNDVSQHPKTLRTFIAGNPEFISAHDLHEQAWKLVHDEVEQARSSAREQLVNARHTSRTAAGPGPVLHAAASGRIDTLFVDCRRPVQGTYDAVNGTAEARPVATESATDLLEAAIRETYLHRGKVLPFDAASMGVEALLRY